MVVETLTAAGTRRSWWLPASLLANLVCIHVTATPLRSWVAIDVNVHRGSRVRDVLGRRGCLQVKITVGGVHEHWGDIDVPHPWYRGDTGSDVRVGPGAIRATNLRSRSVGFIGVDDIVGEGHHLADQRTDDSRGRA